MPGFKSPSSLGNSATTASERVMGSTRLSTLITAPEKMRFGQAAPLASISRPSFTTARYSSGTENSSFMTPMSSSVVMMVFGCTSPPTLILRRPTVPENGARMTVSSRRARAELTCASATCSCAWISSSSTSETTWLAASVSSRP